MSYNVIILLLVISIVLFLHGVSIFLMIWKEIFGVNSYTSGGVRIDNSEPLEKGEIVLIAIMSVDLVVGGIGATHIIQHLC